MKSIVEEASSIEKAITKAWERANRPQKFTVTVFQEAQKNFFGLTKEPAKIGFLYQDVALSKNKKDKNGRSLQKNVKKEAILSRVHEAHTKNTSFQRKSAAEGRVQKNPIVVRKVEDRGNDISEVSVKKVFWPEDIVKKACQWLDNVLETLNSDATYSTSVNRYHLKIKFNKPLFADGSQEKNFFRSISYLMMQAQRAHLKKSFKFHKIVLLSSDKPKGN